VTGTIRSLQLGELTNEEKMNFSAVIGSAAVIYVAYVRSLRVQCPSDRGKMHNMTLRMDDSPLTQGTSHRVWAMEVFCEWFNAGQQCYL
jgi:hypothetical protein